MNQNLRIHVKEINSLITILKTTPRTFFNSPIFNLLLASLLCTIGCNARAAELLDTNRIHKILQMLPEKPAGFAWPITNRSAWLKLAKNDTFKNIIRDAEKLIAKPLPEQPDELFLDYLKTGNRIRWEKVANERRSRIDKLTLAECFENRGRFIPALSETIDSLCAEKTWVGPAHDDRLDNFSGRAMVPDLFSTTLAASMAESDYVLGDHLPAASRKLIRENVSRRVLEPYRAMILGKQKQAYWVTAPMNWNSVCVGNTVFAAEALLDSREDRAFYACAGESCIRYYIAGFTPDGYCAEGVAYWNYGFGHFILLSETLRQSTGGEIDLFKDEAVVAPAMFCKRSEILPGVFPTISDCTPGESPNPQLATYVYRRFGLDSHHQSTVGDQGRLALTLMLSSLPQDLPVARKLSTEGESPLRNLFNDGGVLLARNTPGKYPLFAVALKGGHNAEPHNHNDVGSFSVVLGKKMVICDPGGEIYTSRTFGPHRYDSKVLSSCGHAVPVIAGKLQKTGLDARAVILETNFTDAKDIFKLDIRSAYPVPDLEKLERTFIFQRGKKPSLEVFDEIKFSSPEQFATTLVTWGKIKAVSENKFEITDGDSTLNVSIDTQGRKFIWSQEILDEDVRGGIKPNHLQFTLLERISHGILRFQITPKIR